MESTNAEVLEKIRTEADYFERNGERMRYPTYALSKVPSSAFYRRLRCDKSWLQDCDRLPSPRSGMFWTVSGANAIIALRCCYVNGRFEDYWESCGRVV